VPNLTDVVNTGIYIGGTERFTADHLTVRDPANPERVVGTAAAATKEDAVEAVQSALAAYPAWSAISAAERAAKVVASLDALAADNDENARILTSENGKILQESVIDLLVFSIRTQLAAALADQVDDTIELPGPPVTTTVSFQPLGVVTIIVPFNWPLAILAASLPYALIAGNTVIVKAPPSAPLTVCRVVQKVAEQLPPGVLNVITGEDSEMAPLIANDDVAKVCFTGSGGGGRKVMELASANLTRVTLELGGNDAALILDDAVLDDAAFERLYGGIFESTGQVCMAAKRVYVHRSRYDEVVAGLSKRLSGTVLGHGLDDATTMGPLHSSRQKEYVLGLLDEATSTGTEILQFGELPTGDDLTSGNFVRPTIVLDPSPHLRVVTEEQFGPVVPIIPFDDENEAVAAANDTWGGLCGSVWTASPARANAIGSKLVCGFVFVNDHGAARLDLRAPFGGVRGSGIGREQGIEGIRDFMDTRSIGHPSL
jgi:acyl-CoA reductase-like NAD-dependent aldehyde dehydrogenase